MIREFAAGDIERVVPLLKSLHARSRYARFKPHWPTVCNVIARLASIPSGRVLVAEHGDAITGILIAMADEWWWSEPRVGPRFVTDLLLHSKQAGDGEAMVKDMIAWAWKVPRVVRVEIGISSGINTDAGERFYKSLGLNHLGPMFDLDHPKLQETQPCPA